MFTPKEIKHVNKAMDMYLAKVIAAINESSHTPSNVRKTPVKKLPEHLQEHIKEIEGVKSKFSDTMNRAFDIIKGSEADESDKIKAKLNEEDKSPAITDETLIPERTKEEINKIKEERKASGLGYSDDVKVSVDRESAEKAFPNKSVDNNIVEEKQSIVSPKSKSIKEKLESKSEKNAIDDKSQVPLVIK